MQADDADPLCGLHEHQRRESTADEPQGAIAGLAIVAPGNHREDGRLEIELRDPVEGQPAIGNVAGSSALRRSIQLLGQMQKVGEALGLNLTFFDRLLEGTAGLPVVAAVGEAAVAEEGGEVAEATL
jgi:hypothetical protein